MAGVMAGVMAGILTASVVRAGIRPAVRASFLPAVLGGPLIRAVVAVVIGVILGVSAGIAASLAVKEESEPVGVQWQRLGFNDLLRGLSTGAVAGLIIAAPAKAIGSARGRPASLAREVSKGVSAIQSVAGSGPADGVVAGIAVTVLAGAISWVYRQEFAPFDLGSAARPSTVLTRDRIIGITFGALIGGGVGAAAGIAVGLLAGARLGLAAGVLATVLAGIAGSFGRAAWPSYLMARTWLMLRHRLPRCLMAFLADAHERGVLRQEGAVYQFRHIELQHRLANRDASAVSPERK